MNEKQLFHYPHEPDFVTRLKTEWQKFQQRYGTDRKAKPSLPGDESLLVLLQTIYHVSFLTEESRRLAVRLAFLPQGDCVPDVLNLFQGPVAFSEPRPFTVSEIMRLAPALDPTQSAIVVGSGEGSGAEAPGHGLAIWGLLHLGEDWSALVSGRQSAARVPPACLMLSSFSPGSLVATSAGMVLLRLSGGQITTAPMRGLSQGKVGEFLMPGAQRLYNDALAKLGTRRFSQRTDEEHVPGRLFFQVFENIVRFAAARRHGASFVVVPKDTKEVEQFINLKYRIAPFDVWPELVNECIAYRGYMDLFFSAKAASIYENAAATAEDWKQMENWRSLREASQKRILEFEEATAGLSGVDGVVLLTRDCKVLGFGGEIVSPRSDIAQVQVAEDAEATQVRPKSIEEYGTRHRSAFRLCNSLPDCVVFLVSQDGDARAVKKVGAYVVLWNNVDLRDYAL